MPIPQSRIGMGVKYRNGSSMALTELCGGGLIFMRKKSFGRSEGLTLTDELDSEDSTTPKR